MLSQQELKEWAIRAFAALLGFFLGFITAKGYLLTFCLFLAVAGILAAFAIIYMQKLKKEIEA